MQENRPVENDEIEIDLVELYGELKKNANLIIGTTVAFIVAAAIYCFMIAKPVYQHDVLFRIPANVNNVQINTCNEVLKSQIGVAKGLSGVAVLKNSSIVKLSFSGGTPEQVELDMNSSIPRLEQQVNKAFIEEDRRRFSNDIAKSINNEVSFIGKRLLNNDVTNSEAKEYLKKITQKVELLEQNYLFPQVEVIKKDKVSAVPVSPNKKRNIAIAAVLGLFLSCGYVTARFLIKK